MDKEKMKKEIGRMLDRLQEGGEDFKGSLEETMEDAKSKIKETRRNANRYIMENPERSVLMSAGIGAIVGITLVMLMKRRGHCRHCRE